MLGRVEGDSWCLTHRDSLSMGTKGNAGHMKTEASMWVHLVAQRGREVVKSMDCGVRWPSFKSIVARLHHLSYVLLGKLV